MGSVEAFENVQMTARVAGVVEKVLFSEGAQVRAGQVLVEIEPQRYNLAVEAAQAAFEKATAARADAEAALKRRETVVRQNPGLITAEELETWRTKVRVAIADGAQAAAALDQAKLNLHDAYVRTPVGGVIQTRTVQTGQYVQPGTILASLLRRDPLLLRFQVPEQDAVASANRIEGFFPVGQQRPGIHLPHHPCGRLGRCEQPHGGRDGRSQRPAKKHAAGGRFQPKSASPWEACAMLR